MNNPNNPFSSKPINNNPFLAGDKNSFITSTNNQSNQQGPQNNNPEINQNNPFPSQGNLFVNKNPNTNPLELKPNLPFSLSNNQPTNSVSIQQSNNPVQNPINNIFNSNNNNINPLNPSSSNTNLNENKEKTNPFQTGNNLFPNQQIENNNKPFNFASNNKISNPLNNNFQQNANKTNETSSNNIFGVQAQQNMFFSGNQNNNTATFNINNQSDQFVNQNNSAQNISTSENLNKSNSSNQNGNNNNLFNLEKKPESTNTDNKNNFANLNLNKQISFGDGKLLSTNQPKPEDKNIKPAENLNNYNNFFGKPIQDLKSNTNIEQNLNDPNKPKGPVLGSSSLIVPPNDVNKDLPGILNNPKTSEGLNKPEVNIFKNDSSKNLLNNSIINNPNDKKIESNASKDPKINLFGSNISGNVSNNIVKPEIADSNKPKLDNKLIPNNLNVNKPNASQDNTQSVNKGLDSRN